VTTIFISGDRIRGKYVLIINLYKRDL